MRAALTTVVRRTGRDRTVGRVTRIIDDAHVEVAWGDQQRAEQPAVHVEFTDELKAAA